jgi:hypothetical protein
MFIRHVVESACLSVDDDPAAQSFSDWELVCEAVLYAAKTQLDIDNPFANAFPGDHYRLLSGLFQSLDNKSRITSIVDVGTHYGTGTRVMLDYAPKAAVATFDIAPWDSYPKTFLESSDFSNNGGRLTQYLADLKDQTKFEEHKTLLMNADFIMCDGPKDGVFEENFISKLSSLSFNFKRRFLFLDDIRFPSEALLWRRIQSPKIDLTSFGHFTGSGLVNISRGLELAPA